METKNLDWKHFLLSHLVWIIALTVALVVGHAALQEHDARMAADARVKADEATVATLQSQIAVNNAAAVSQKQIVIKEVQAAKTPVQIIASVPTLTSDVIAQQLQPRIAPDDPKAIEVQAVPFVDLLGEYKKTTIDLATCQSNLTNETAIATQKQDEVAALKKKKPALWKRIFGSAKAFGVGVGVGIAIAAHHGL